MSIKSKKPIDPFYARLEAFIEMVLSCAPDAETLAAFAKKYPDKYGSLIGALYRARDGQDAPSNVIFDVKRMSDSQIEDELNRRGISVEPSYEQALGELENSNILDYKGRRVKLAPRDD